MPRYSNTTTENQPKKSNIKGISLHWRNQGTAAAPGYFPWIGEGKKNDSGEKAGQV
jgi:hypothetical protein